MDAPAAIAGVFPNMFHQVAMFTDDIDRAVKVYEGLGYDDWSFDEAVLVGHLYGSPVETKARMAFNYQIMPMEVEFLTYYGPSRHQGRPTLCPFISHMSVHVPSIDEMVALIRDEFGVEPFHTFETKDHTNPNVVGKKRFKEAIYNTTKDLGYDLKMIERIAW